MDLVWAGGVLGLSQPRRQIRHEIPALDGPVTVRFDPWQRPYVKAGPVSLTLVPGRDG